MIYSPVVATVLTVAGALLPISKWGGGGQGYRSTRWALTSRSL